MLTLKAYFEQFRGDLDPMAVCRQRNRHTWYSSAGIYGRFAECRECHVRLQESAEHPPDRVNWLEYHMARLDGELRGQASHEDYIGVCRANGKHEWYKLHGGLQCRQCGLQMPFPEPFTVEQMDAAIKRSSALDAELRSQAST